MKAWFVAVSRRTKEGKNNVYGAAVDELVLRCNPQIFALNVAEEDGCHPANNWTFSKRSENVLSWFIERFVKTFFGRIFVEGFGRP